MSPEEIEKQKVPLTERMVREPFWLGLITVMVVMIVIMTRCDPTCWTFWGKTWSNCAEEPAGQLPLDSERKWFSLKTVGPSFIFRVEISDNWTKQCNPFRWRCHLHLWWYFLFLHTWRLTALPALASPLAPSFLSFFFLKTTTSPFCRRPNF